MKVIRQFTLVGSGLMLMACEPATERYIYRADTTVSRADRDFFECEVAAARAVPQQTQIATTPRYTTPVQTSCYNIGYSVQCSSTGGQTFGGQTYSYDANANLRSRYLARCLIDKGYTSADLPKCETSRIPSDLLGQLGGRQRQPTEGACYVPVTARIGNVVYASELNR